MRGNSLDLLDFLFWEQIKSWEERWAFFETKCDFGSDFLEIKLWDKAEKYGFFEVDEVLNEWGSIDCSGRVLSLKLEGFFVLDLSRS